MKSTSNVHSGDHCLESRNPADASLMGAVVGSPVDNLPGEFAAEFAPVLADQSAQEAQTIESTNGEPDLGISARFVEVEGDRVFVPFGGTVEVEATIDAKNLNNATVLATSGTQLRFIDSSNQNLDFSGAARSAKDVLQLDSTGDQQKIRFTVQAADQLQRYGSGAGIDVYLHTDAEGDAVLDDNIFDNVVLVNYKAADGGLELSIIDLSESFLAGNGATPEDWEQACEYQVPEALDVDGNCEVTSKDALHVIDTLKGQIDAEAADRVFAGLDTDVNDDGHTTSLDALTVIDYLKARVERMDG